MFFLFCANAFLLLDFFVYINTHTNAKEEECAC
jgi:hypothetical protein